MMGGLYLSKTVTLIDVESVFIQNCGQDSAIYIPDLGSAPMVHLFVRSCYDSHARERGAGNKFLLSWARYKAGGSTARMLKIEVDHERQIWTQR